MKARLLVGAVVVALAIAVSCAATEKEKSYVKVSHLSAGAVGVACLNGADPTGNKVGDVLIISCGSR